MDKKAYGTALYAARLAWLGLLLLTPVWDGYFAPLNTGWVLLAVKLVPLMLPLRGIWTGRVYTYQYCTMLVLAYFAEGVMRLFDASATSRVMAAVELLLSLLFFVSALIYLQQFKRRRKQGGHDG